MAQSVHIQNYAPRGLRRLEAASYVGMKTTKFDGLVADGRMPKPRRVDSIVVWDKFELDLAFDDLPHGDELDVVSAGFDERLMGL